MGQNYPRSWRWPDGQMLAMSIGLGFEAFAYQSQFRTQVGGPGQVNHFSLSYGDYGWKAGAWRLLELLDNYGLKANISVNGLAAENHPAVVSAASRAGHEINGHGWANDIPVNDDDPQAELEEIKRCTEVLTEAAGVRPVGWTGPGSTRSAHTWSFLKAEGYLWNGDDASDDLPFLHQTEHGPLVILPRTNSPHNDLTMWLVPRNPPDILWQGFKESFDQLYAEGNNGNPKWIEITLHCHIAGRPVLQPTIRRCLDYAKKHDGVWFARRCDIAEWALQHEIDQHHHHHA